ncbi:hypothetical protein GGF46_000223 [Coemansia sp. RSA 552]|nr:hypothetical protein GGF46_000223 [Coemansia sp. RSA 552]
MPADPPRTPLKRSRSMAPQSAPAKPQARRLFASPQPARRGSTSMEAFRVARTLKEGLTRLKSLASGDRSASATTPVRRSTALTRHHSELPRLGSFPHDPLRPPASCPQRLRRSESSVLCQQPLPPPDFSQARHPKDDESAEAAAEAMILFMRSEPSSQNDPSSPSLLPAALPSIPSTSQPALLPSSATASDISVSDEPQSAAATEPEGSPSPSPPLTSPKRARLQCDEHLPAKRIRQDIE